MDFIGLPINIFPLQAQQFTTAQTHAQLHVDDQLHLCALGGLNELLNLLFCVDNGGLFSALGKHNALTGRAGNDANQHSLVHSAR